MKEETMLKVIMYALLGLVVELFVICAAVIIMMSSAPPGA